MTTTITGATGIDNIQAATGSVIQVVQNAVNSPSYTNASGSYVAIADMTVTITPQSSSSKVLVTFNCGGAVVGQATNQNKYSCKNQKRFYCSQGIRPLWF